MPPLRLQHKAPSPGTERQRLCALLCSCTCLLAGEYGGNHLASSTGSVPREVQAKAPSFWLSMQALCSRRLLVHLWRGSALSGAQKAAVHLRCSGADSQNAGLLRREVVQRLVRAPDELLARCLSANRWNSSFRDLYPRGWKKGKPPEEQPTLKPGVGSPADREGLASDTQPERGDASRAKGSRSGGGAPGPNWWALLVFGSGLAAALWLSGSESGASNPFSTPKPRQISFQEFSREYLERGLVSHIVVVNRSEARVFLKREAQGRASARPGNGSPWESPWQRPVATFVVPSVDVLERRLEDIQSRMGREPIDYIPIVYRNETSALSTLVNWAPTILLIGAYIYIVRRMSGLGGFGARGGTGAGFPFGGMLRPPGSSGSTGSGSGAGGITGGGIFNVGRASVTVLNRDPKSRIGTRFSDVAGLDEAKEEIMEFVSYLKSPERYKRIGAKIPKGALLHGPPGTGKTLLAKATAGESGVPFLTINGSDFMELFVGVGPSRVRDLFAQARQLAPCIVFIDEIDAIGRSRGRGGLIGGNDERENTLNQLLVEMDGFQPNSGVVVLAGTNRVDVLDPALLRPGRFDRQIAIDPPDIKGRKDIFLVHLRPLKLDPSIDREAIAKELAARTPGFAGADIANVCNESALIAARAGAKGVARAHFEAAIDRVIGGIEKKTMVMSPEEKRTVAYHEAGHAVAGWFLEYASPLLKVSIVPRGSAALGYAQYQPRDQRLYSREQLLDLMCMTLAGRVSEEIFFGQISTGAADDFSKITTMAYNQVTQWGMGDALGNLAFQRRNDDTSPRFYKPYSDKTAQKIDEEVRQLVRSAYERTRSLLEEKKEQVRLVAEELLANEMITREGMETLLGKRPFVEHKTFDELAQGASPTGKAATVAQDKALSGADPGQGVETVGGPTP